jgi:hypothetical protein
MFAHQWHGSCHGSSERLHSLNLGNAPSDSVAARRSSSIVSTRPRCRVKDQIHGSEVLFS